MSTAQWGWKMSNIDIIYPAWDAAHAFLVNDDVYEKSFISSSEDDEDILTLTRIDEWFLMYEIIIDVDMINDGKITDDKYTLETKDRDGRTLLITPLFMAGKRRGADNGR